MTYAAIFRLATLASIHALTEEEIAAALRAARTTGPATISVDVIESAITAVIAARAAHAA